MLLLSLAAAVIAESALVRSGLSAILGGSAALRVVASVPPEEAPALDTVQVDVVVRELADGASAEDALAQAPAGIPVLALAAPEQARALLHAGAHGVVSRDATPERVAAASEAVANGLYALDERTFEAAFLRPSAAADAGTLTPREREVLELVADGLSNKLIAERLGISEHTAKFHVRSLLDKVGAETRADLVARAARRGLLHL